MQAMEISRTGLDVEWRRLEIIAQNLANANTVRTADGGVYRAQRLISGPRGGFGAMLDPDGTRAVDAPALGVEVYGIEPDSAPPRMVHEPANPQADADGFVAYPDIDQAEQMTLMVKTARIYEANIVALTSARQMYAEALEIGRQG
jgi:flagellar basal-body rod protein FlgC